MRKKLLSKTYLRDIRKYKIYFDFSNDDYYMAIKSIIEGDEFITDKGEKLIYNGSYIIEITPKNEYYSMRAYLGNDLTVLGYYFDISRQNGLDEETKIPYYDDLFLDVGINGNNEIVVMDENELDNALDKNIITKAEYDLAINTCEKLVNEIKTNENRYYNMDLKAIVQKYINLKGE